MPVRVVFLGPLRDLAGEEARDLPGPLDWPGLLRSLPAPVAEQLKTARVNLACGGVVLVDKAALDARDGDEVALLPPVSGG